MCVSTYSTSVSKNSFSDEIGNKLFYILSDLFSPSEAPPEDT